MLGQYSFYISHDTLLSMDKDEHNVVQFLKSQCRKINVKFHYIDGVGSAYDGYNITVVGSKIKRVLIRR